MLAPLDTAACLYRAQPVSPIPNEGTRAEPLTLSPTLVYVQDALGSYLRYAPGADAYATAAVPVAVLNGDLTVAVRWRPEAPWTQRLLVSLVDTTGQKTFMLTCASDNRYLARFWGTNWAQIGAQGTTPASVDRTDTLVVTWTGATRENRLMVNGALEATGTSPVGRLLAVDAPLQVPFPHTSLGPAGKLFAIGVWDRALTPAECAALPTNADWLSGGASTPEPPAPPPCVVRFNGVPQPWSVRLDGVPVGGPGDTIDVTG